MIEMEYVTVRMFKGQTYIDIREFYMEKVSVSIILIMKILF